MVASRGCQPDAKLAKCSDRDVETHGQRDLFSDLLPSRDTDSILTIRRSNCGEVKDKSGTGI
jgi:hypothetical protein